MAERIKLEPRDNLGTYRVYVVDDYAQGGSGLSEVAVFTFEFTLSPTGGTPMEQATARLAQLRTAPPATDPAREAWERALARLRRAQGFVALGVIPDNDARLVNLRQTVRDGLVAYGNL